MTDHHKKIVSLTDLPSLAAYFQRIGAEPRSLRTAVVKEQRGNYWKDIGVITIEKTGEVKAPQGFEPTQGEMEMIKADCSTTAWPEHIRVAPFTSPPEALKGVDPDDIFIFRDESEQIIMMQQRIDREDGGKNYVPWTYWSDGEWRMMEPEGKLPLYNLNKIKDKATIFIHEGAKAARNVARIAEGDPDHPWYSEVRNAAHVGWVGGALNPARTDWGPINAVNPSRVYIISDNDHHGVSAVPLIAYRLKVPTYHIQFSQEWPSGFDLGDPFPEKMFRDTDGKRFYIGPSMRACTHPATWATDLIPNPNGKGKPVMVLRDSFVNQWAYVEHVNLFVCICLRK